MIDWSEQDMRVSRTELKKAHERLAFIVKIADLVRIQGRRLKSGWKKIDKK